MLARAAASSAALLSLAAIAHADLLTYQTPTGTVEIQGDPDSPAGAFHEFLNRLLPLGVDAFSLTDDRPGFEGDVSASATHASDLRARSISVTGVADARASDNSGQSAAFAHAEARSLVSFTLTREAVVSFTGAITTRNTDTDGPTSTAFDASLSGAPSGLLFFTDQAGEFSTTITLPPGNYRVAASASVESTLTGGGDAFLGGEVAYTVDLVAMPTTPLPCDADLDMSGVVDLPDLLAVLSVFGANDPAADFDASGTVGLPDLLFLLSAFGTQCP